MAGVGTSAALVLVVAHQVADGRAGADLLGAGGAGRAAGRAGLAVAIEASLAGWWRRCGMVTEGQYDCHDGSIVPDQPQV